jgi:hypothetical protein
MLLEKHLLIFDLHIDHDKTQFVRSSTDLPETAEIRWNKVDSCWNGFDAQKRMKWLGF